MAFDYHKDKDRYFQMQYLTARDYIIPFVKGTTREKSPLQVLEIGCAEAGVLKAFVERGDQCLGIELSESRTKLAEAYFEDELKDGQIKFLNKNIYDIDIEKDIGHRFDLIILKDVIEHIPNQELFIPKLQEYLNPDGIVFFGFPPWWMPFGGHQQIAKSKFLSLLPYYHLLPMPLYKGILKLFNEKPGRIEDLVEIKETGITIERFERIVKSSGFKIAKRKFWLFNPIYKFKFNLNPRKQIALIGGIPYVRNFLTTAGYYIIKKA